MTKTLKCDKPVDLDEARKAKGLPRRKRDDPKATAYELRIRVPAEFQGVMGRKKLSRTVFARNKREELRRASPSSRKMPTECLKIGRRGWALGRKTFHR